MVTIYLVGYLEVIAQVAESQNGYNKRGRVLIGQNTDGIESKWSQYT